MSCVEGKKIIKFFFCVLIKNLKFLHLRRLFMNCKPNVMWCLLNASLLLFMASTSTSLPLPSSWERWCCGISKLWLMAIKALNFNLSFFIIIILIIVIIVLKRGMCDCTEPIRPFVCLSVHFYTLNTGINVFCMLTNVYQCMFNNLNDKEIKMNESLMKFIFNFLKQQQK